MHIQPHQRGINVPKLASREYNGAHMPLQAQNRNLMTQQKNMDTDRLFSEEVSKSPTVDIPIDKVMLDPDNPRIQFLMDSYVSKGIKQEDVTQKQLMFGLRAKTKAKYETLKESIETKGLLSPIWVAQTGDHFIVIEGNTRRLVFEDLSKKYAGDEKWKTITARVMPRNTPKDIIAFLRLEYHLGGIEPWDPYERARYLSNLKEQGYTTERLARESRSSETEIKNDIKAFEVMRDNFLPKHGAEVDNPLEKYSYFVELVGKTKVKNLINSGQFSVDDFCAWVAEERIPRAIDVRDLPEIFSQEDIATAFKKRGYQQAMDLLASTRPEIASSLFRDIEKVTEQIKQLRHYEVTQIRNEEPIKKEKILKLIEALQSVLN